MYDDCTGCAKGRAKVCRAAWARGAQGGKLVEVQRFIKKNHWRRAPPFGRCVRTASADACAVASRLLRTSHAATAAAAAVGWCRVRGGAAQLAFEPRRHLHLIGSIGRHAQHEGDVIIGRTELVDKGAEQHVPPLALLPLEYRQEDERLRADGVG